MLKNGVMREFGWILLMRIGLCETNRRLGRARAPVACFAAALMCIVTGLPGASGQPDGGVAPEPYVKRPASGAVIGHVIDAETREPIEGAGVSVQVDGAFPDTGPGATRSDEAGRYQLRAPLGRKKSSTKLSILVILGEPIRKRETNIIDVTQLNVNVACDGYKPFVGPVSIRHAAVSRFKVYLAEIFLAPEGSRLASHAPSDFRWEHLEDFSVTPDTAEPGSKVTMTARLRVRHEPGMTHRIFVIGPGALLEADALPVTSRGEVHRIAIPLKLNKSQKQDDGEHQEFTGTARIRRRPKIDHGLLQVALFRGTNNVTPTDLRPVLLQAPDSDETKAAAELCREAYYLHDGGELGLALERAKAAVEAAPDYEFAHEMLGDLYLASNRPEAAIEALTRLAELDPDDADTDVEATLPKLAEALLAAGRPKEGIELLKPLDKDTQQKKYRTESKMSAGYNIALARCYLALGEFKDADARLKRAGLLSPTLRRQLTIERARAVTAGEPDSLDARVGLGRALADAGQWEEAIGEFRTAAEDEESDAWQYTDLAWALMEGVERHDEALIWAHRAVVDDPDNAEARLRLGDCFRHLGQYDEAATEYAAAATLRPADFQARHWNGLMMLWRGETEAGAEELLAALDLAREKGEHRPSYFGLFIPVATTRVLVHGFRFPEADYDYVILDALTTLRAQGLDEEHPDAFLAKHNMAAAFVELGLPDAALPLLEECLEARPDYVDSLYTSARAHMAKGDSDTAEDELRRVVEAASMHPDAYLDLAKLRLEAGDPAAAQRYVLQHRRNYPESAPRRPVGPTEKPSEPE